MKLNTAVVQADDSISPSKVENTGLVNVLLKPD